MKHFILGYGYCGYYLAQELLNQKHRVWTLSRSLKEEYILDGVTHLRGDLSQGICLPESMSVIHYLAPPDRNSKKDELLQSFLAVSKLETNKIIYYGSSGVYGDQEGALTDEKTPCLPEFERQYRRLDAEKQWMAYGEANDIPILLLRLSGMLGPNRLPIKQVLQGTPVIKVAEAPWTNSIYVKDLVKIAILAVNKTRKTSILNISDGIPTPMGSTQRLLAILMQHHRVYEKSFNEVYDESSEFKREFLMSSRKLSIEKLKKILKSDLVLTDKVNAIKESLLLMGEVNV